MRLKNYTSSIVVLFLSACAQGPDYSIPAANHDAVFLQAENVDGVLVDAWWEEFEDPLLNDLILQANSQSPRLDAARARLDAARAARGIARSERWPGLTLSGSYTEFEQSLESANGFGQLVNAGLAQRNSEFYATEISTRWELDLWGRIRRGNERALAEWQAAGALYQAQQLSQLAQTAIAYFEYLGAQARLQSAKRNIELLGETAELARKRQRIGIGRKVDAQRSVSVLHAAEAQLPRLEAVAAASLYSLGVLTGSTPSEIAARVSPRALPSAPAMIAPGTPADLLRRRPDIIAAERRLAAATAEVGIRQARFFPTLTIGASYGFEAVESSRLGSSDARSTAVVPFISWPVLQGGRLRSQYDSGRAQLSAAAADYEQAILEAIAGTETALVRYRASRESKHKISAAVTASESAADLARKLYQQGLASYLVVLDAERARLELQDQLIIANTQVLLESVNLYKTLGGGWLPAPEVHNDQSTD